MFQWSICEKIKLLVLYIANFFSENYQDEDDGYYYVPIRRVMVEATEFVLFWSLSQNDFEIYKTELKPSGEYYVPVKSSQFDLAFLTLFSDLFPQRKSEFCRLIEDVGPYFDEDEVRDSWNSLCKRFGNKTYTVVEVQCSTVSKATSCIPYVIENATAAVLMKDEEERDNVDTKAMEAASILRAAKQADYAIVFAHKREYSSVVITDSNGNMKTARFFNSHFDDLEQVPLIVAHKAGEILLEMIQAKVF